MNRETFNYWYNMYTLYYKHPPPSLHHLDYYVNSCYYNQYNIQPFIPVQQLVQPITDINPEIENTQPIQNIKNRIQNKDDCTSGMSCKNVHCTYFHHPSADPDISLKK